MSIARFIYWDQPEKTPDGQAPEPEEATVHYLVGYNMASLQDFKEMTDELRNVFPQIQDKHVICGQVQKSSMYQGFTIIGWRGLILRGEYPGFIQRDSKSTSQEYKW